MARAYAYVDKHEPAPRELEAGYMIEQYGSQAVYGRVLGVSEMRRMNIVRNIVDAYHSRAACKEGYAAWAEKHPRQADLLNSAIREYHEQS